MIASPKAVPVVGLKSSGATGSCSFCDEIAGADSEFRKIYSPDIDSRVLYSDADFVVVPSIGQVVEGYLLIVPRVHVYSMGQLDLGALRLLEQLREGVRRALSRTYGHPIFFEHGCPGEEEGGCGIYHAHLHAVPVGQRPGLEIALRRQFSIRKIEALNDLRCQDSTSKAYLFYEDAVGSKFVCHPERIESQFMRRLLANEILGSEWDWRKSGREPRLLSCLRRLKGVISCN